MSNAEIPAPSGSRDNSEAYLEPRLAASIKGMLTEDFASQLARFALLGAERLYRVGRQALDDGDLETARTAEALNRLINNCKISSECFIGHGTNIAYGGIGVLIHHASRIGRYCTIGTNVTLGAAPTIGDYVYLATGSAVVGKEARVGSFCVVGANAVITRDVPAGSVVAGVPARIIGKITSQNLRQYQGFLLGSARGNAEAEEAFRIEFTRFEQERDRLQ